LCVSRSTQIMFALKIFPYQAGKISSFYLNEIRFSKLLHPNIVSMFYHDDKRETIQNGYPIKISYILMEFAPFGDFLDLITNSQVIFDSLLLRTYFHQLIDGIEYLHSQSIAHIDIKPDNLLLDEKFQLKVADFDLSFVKGDKNLIKKGTKFYRAPEVLNETCDDPFKADIFSAGIVLFVLKSGGILPQHENLVHNNLNFYHLLQYDNDKFWNTQCEIINKSADFYEEDFRYLFNWMTKEKPEERATLQDIKKSKWYNGPTYDDNLKLFKVMSKHFQ